MEIYPDNIRTGVPITVRFEARPPFAGLMKVNPQSIAGAMPFTVPMVKAREGSWSGQFTVLLPGNYQLVLGSESRIIQVKDQVNLSFDKEFGFFSLGVIVLVGGMLVWLKQSKKVV